jgi:hypothetical protein
MLVGSCFPDKEKFVPGPLRRFIRGDLIHQEKWFYDTAALTTPPYVLRFQQIPPLVGANADITGAISPHASVGCLGSGGYHRIAARAC